MRGRGRGWKVAKSDRDRGEVREGKLRLYRRGKGGLMGMVGDVTESGRWREVTSKRRKRGKATLGRG